MYVSLKDSKCQFHWTNSASLTPYWALTYPLSHPSLNKKNHLNLSYKTSYEELLNRTHICANEPKKVLWVFKVTLIPKWTMLCLCNWRPFFSCRSELYPLERFWWFQLPSMAVNHLMYNVMKGAYSMFYSETDKANVSDLIFKSLNPIFEISNPILHMLNIRDLLKLVMQHCMLPLYSFLFRCYLLGHCWNV